MAPIYPPLGGMDALPLLPMLTCIVVGVQLTVAPMQVSRTYAWWVTVTPLTSVVEGLVKPT